jgi:hypothetical protein
MGKIIILGWSMNKRKKKWEKELNEGIKIYENKSNQTYDYYGKINRRHHIKQTKGLGHWSTLFVRILLASILIFYQLRGCGIGI